jgi:L-ascorbate metabolism protein UlaG (beta-lactamase superfamily)
MTITTTRTEQTLTYIGGPTVLLELGGLTLITDPTFDMAGTSYPTKIYTLRKSEDPAVSVDALGKIDVVLLSHDHHFDNLDNKGRSLLATAGRVLTTPAGAERLGGGAVGLSTWESIELPSAPHGRVRVTSTPARHGPANGDRGPVTGFLLESLDGPDGGIYISGDTVWYEGIEEVARRFSVKTAILFMGAAVVSQVGSAHLTMTAEEGVQAARAFPDAAIVPVHFEGWQHFSESRRDIQAAFDEAGTEDRLVWLPPGIPVPCYAPRPIAHRDGARG